MDNPYDFDSDVIVNKKSFEGASTNYKIGSKGLVYNNNDRKIASEIIYLQLRSQYAINNNAYASIGLKRWSQFLGIMNVTWNYSSGKNKGKKHSRMQDLWDDFIENPFFDSYTNGCTLQDIWKKELFIQGANFTRFRLVKGKNKGKVPLKLELIPAEFHDILYNEPTRNIYNGIQYDSSGRVINFFFRKNVRESLFNPLDSSQHIVLSEDEICNGFVQNRVSQSIGIPVLAPCLLVLYSLDELLDATLERQKNAQAISWLVEDYSPSAPLAFGGVRKTTDQLTGEDKIIFEAVGGNVQVVPKGKKVNFATVEDIGANFQILIDRQLGRIASALDLDYHIFTGDVSGLNFAIIKALGHYAKERREYFHNTVTIPKNLIPLTNKFQDFASLRFPDAEKAKAQFEYPRTYGADELKDAQADVLELRYGLTTITRCLRERGVSYEELIADIALQKELGLYDLLKQTNNSDKQPNNIESNSNTKGN